MSGKPQQNKRFLSPDKMTSKMPFFRRDSHSYRHNYLQYHDDSFLEGRKQYSVIVDQISSLMRYQRTTYCDPRGRRARQHVIGLEILTIAVGFTSFFLQKRIHWATLGHGAWRVSLHFGGFQGKTPGKFFTDTDGR